MVVGRNGNAYRDYAEYIRSWEWRWFRETILPARDYQCERCGWPAPEVVLHLHHLHYETLGKETEKDVLVLCEECHKKEHKIDERPQAFNERAMRRWLGSGIIRGIGPVMADRIIDTYGDAWLVALLYEPEENIGQNVVGLTPIRLRGIRESIIDSAWFNDTMDPSWRDEVLTAADIDTPGRQKL